MIFPPKPIRLAALLFACFVTAAFADQKENFQIRVSGLGPNGQIPDDFALNQFGCYGKNVSPETSWSGAPAETKSFALAVWDSDAPKASGFYHWMIVNIPGSAHSLPAGAGNLNKRLAPTGAVQLKNDYGEPGYGGPCHRDISSITTTLHSSRLRQNISQSINGPPRLLQRLSSRKKSWARRRSSRPTTGNNADNAVIAVN